MDDGSSNSHRGPHVIRIFSYVKPSSTLAKELLRSTEELPGGMTVLFVISEDLLEAAKFIEERNVHGVRMIALFSGSSIDKVRWISDELRMNVGLRAEIVEIKNEYSIESDRKNLNRIVEKCLFKVVKV